MDVSRKLSSFPLQCVIRAVALQRAACTCTARLGTPRRPPAHLAGAVAVTPHPGQLSGVGRQFRHPVPSLGGGKKQVRGVNTNGHGCLTPSTTYPSWNAVVDLSCRCYSHGPQRINQCLCWASVTCAESLFAECLLCLRMPYPPRVTVTGAPRGGWPAASLGPVFKLSLQFTFFVSQ